MIKFGQDLIKFDQNRDFSRYCILAKKINRCEGNTGAEGARLVEKVGIPEGLFTRAWVLQMSNQERVGAERATGQVGACCRCPFCAVVEQLTGIY